VLGFFLALNTDALRDRGFGPPAGSKEKAPYSLARCQAAFWFFLIFASFAWLWVVTGTYDGVINETALILMGIGSGTALGAWMIDASNVSETEKVVRPLLDREAAAMKSIEDTTGKIAKQEDALQKETDPARAAPIKTQIAALQASLDTAKQELAKARGEIAQLAPKIGSRVSQGWWLDVVTDKSGVSFHRFQMVAWTLILGLVFLLAVLNGLSMPVFNTTLLALVGISAGTYLGFKFPEKHA
jgi:hypothetical protein